MEKAQEIDKFGWHSKLGCGYNGFYDRNNDSCSENQAAKNANIQPMTSEK